MIRRQTRPTHAIVEGQGHLVKLSCKGAEAVGGGKRGRVSGFSGASRKRLLETLARLDPERTEFPVTLITLTYGQEFPGPERAKRDRFTFYKRVARWWPGTAAIWRLEFQQRGAPHFHLIYFGPFLGKFTVQQWWGEVIGQERPFTRIEALRNWRHGMAYAAKYLAKVPQVQAKGAEADGTAAGGGGDAPDSGLDYVTYLTAGESVGRVWSV